MIRAAGAEPAGVALALDRREKGSAELSAVQEVNRDYGLPVFSIASLDDVLVFLQDGGDAALLQFKDKVAAYRRTYGISGE